MRTRDQRSRDPRPGRLACAIAAAGLALPTAAAADCIAYDTPDTCDMLGTVGEGFWIDEWSVDLGVILMTVDGMPFTPPSEPPAPDTITIFELGSSLGFANPLIGEATFQPVGAGGERWDWPAGLFAGVENPSLADIELTAGCDGTAMPRWRAPVTNVNGPDMRLDVVAVSPRLLFGHQHFPGAITVDGHSVTFDRVIVFSRDRFPVDDLETVVLSSASCDVVCDDDPWLCPSRDAG
ncbi:MAG: hypothetical protein RLO50_15910 [Azospirillaceae bacterium]